MNNPITNFASGFSYPFRALRFARQNPRLFLYITIPFLINIVVFSLAVYFGLFFFQQFVISHLPQGEAWYWVFLTYILWIVAVLVTMVLIFFLFTALGNLIASPFNEILSEKTEAILTGKESDAPFHLPLFFKQALKTIMEEGKKISFFIIGMLFLLLLNLIPIVGSLAYAFLSVFWTLYFLVVEYTGYIFSRKLYTFQDQRKFIKSHFTLLTGFGAGLLLVLAIPLFQFLCIPLGVIGATLLCAEVEDGKYLNP